MRSLHSREFFPWIISVTLTASFLPPLHEGGDHQPKGLANEDLELFRDSLSLQSQRGQLLDSLCHVIVSKQTRSGNEAVCPGIGTGPDGFFRGLDATVDLDIDVQSTIDDPLSDLLDLGGHGRNELLTTESWVDRHDQNVINEVQDVLHHFCRCVRVQGDARRTATRTDLGQSAVQVRTSFDVDDDHSRFAVGALGDVDKLIQHGIGTTFADHELGFEGEVAIPTTVTDGIRSKPVLARIYTKEIEHTHSTALTNKKRKDFFQSLT